MWREETKERILLRKKAAWTAFYDANAFFLPICWLTQHSRGTNMVLGLIALAASAATPKFGSKLKIAVKQERDRISERSEAGKGQRVDLVLSQNGIVTGSDSGLMWEKDGVLYFEGVRSSFRLTKRLNNLTCRATKKTRVLSFVVEQHFKINLAFTRPASGPVDRWMKAPVSKVLNVLPPLALAPEIAHPMRYVHIQAAILAAAFLALAFMHVASRNSATIELSVFFALTLFLSFLLVRDYRRAELKKMIEARPWLLRYSQEPVNDSVGVIGSLASSR